MRTRISLLAVPALALTARHGRAGARGVLQHRRPGRRQGSLTDIYGFEANHGEDNVLVKVRFNELMRTSAAGVSVFFDTDRDAKGPEYVLSSGLGDGTDYVLTEADGWRGSDDRVRCDYSARPKWGQDVFRAAVSRDCFDRVPLGAGLGEDGRPGGRLPPGRRLGAQAPAVDPADRVGARRLRRRVPSAGGDQCHGQAAERQPQRPGGVDAFAQHAVPRGRS